MYERMSDDFEQILERLDANDMTLKHICFRYQRLKKKNLKTFVRFVFHFFGLYYYYYFLFSPFSLTLSLSFSLSLFLSFSLSLFLSFSLSLFLTPLSSPKVIMCFKM